MQTRRRGGRDLRQTNFIREPATESKRERDRQRGRRHGWKTRGKIFPKLSQTMLIAGGMK